ncbi:dihydrodipicolinate reductase-like protein CRR1, chloroplastic [Phragmites australis]|uniref:dihydrodipicolinate reductase-like protein CRR1, chloroplastic n=1 Tax=Phragmites australis TaxID=29695 RepID=UPI002D780C41|nr:dihydrodipicolinate reductase-like protein CRR1, chloroplastic [Phragmites australis]
MVSLWNPIQIRTCGKVARRNAAKVFCSMDTIKVVTIGATKEIGRTGILAKWGIPVSKKGGNGAHRRRRALQISGMKEQLEIPVLNDLTMVLGSIAQAAAFGLSSVVYVPKIELDTVTELSAFYEKESMGFLVAPTLSIGSVLLQQAAIQASFHYSNVEIVESRPNPSDLPLQDAIQIENNISDLGQLYNREVMESDRPVSVRSRFAILSF